MTLNEIHRYKNRSLLQNCQDRKIRMNLECLIVVGIESGAMEGSAFAEKPVEKSAIGLAILDSFHGRGSAKAFVLQ